jgi:Raf kinase inhibitor-like YbhB/YbcL family protein
MSGAGISGSGTVAAAGAGSAAVAAAAGTPAAGSGGSGGTSGMSASAAAFVLTPIDFPMAGDELTFPQTANPPTNQSPEFTWTGVPAEAKTLALAFRDLGNGAVKWIIWDMPPTLMHIPPNVTPVAMPPEVPGSSQLGSLDNQGYAGPGMGARQYDFTLWALDTDKLPVTARMTTVQIHDLLDMHELAKTPPVLVRNTRNL